ncbi:hypothetical protein AB1K62_08100 [Parasphingorhabdus sp. JC815]|uniref:hypothetical protein n=1 Tax=Parasphingorhabdus sp. JC815 TaxID=3232140 RepID=UPI003457AC4E
MSDWTTDSQPQLLRISSITSTVPDMIAAQNCYRELLNYRLVESGFIDKALAARWNTPAACGAAFCTLVPQNEDNVFIRLIEGPSVMGYRPLTSFGWAAFEIIVDDVYHLADRLSKSPFRHLAGPAPLQFMPSIVAMQVEGLGGECLYFTMETGDRNKSILPQPSGFVGRPFIVVAAGGEFDPMLRWYVDNFQLRERPVRQSKVAILQQAQGLGADHEIFLSAIGMAQHGNLIELDEYPTGLDFIAGPRSRADGHLPPGNAIVSFEVDDLEPYIKLADGPVNISKGVCYGGRRSLVLTGMAGELIELIESV